MFFKTDDTKKKPGDGDPAGTGGESLTLPLLPLRDIIVFPHMVVPLFVGREKSIAALEEAMNRDKQILLTAQKKAKTNEPAPEDVYPVGTLASIIQLLRLPDRTMKVLVEGKKRVQIDRFLPSENYFLVEAHEIPEEGSEGLEIEALLRSVKSSFEQYVRLNKRIPPEMLLSVSQIDEPGRLADTIVTHLAQLKLSDKQALLEEPNTSRRLNSIFQKLNEEIEILKVERSIKSRVKRQMEKTQREYYLNEQMRAIQRELGERDEFKNEFAEIEEKIREKKLSEEAFNKVTKELKKLKMMSPMSAEATVVRNYIDWILALPWQEFTDDKLDLKVAEEILEADHYGLDKIKDRIVEYLAVLRLVKKMRGPILCLVGPPGVGKTSLGKSIARALGRKFVRVSLGGVRDEAEIRGHRRTYIGAMPGKIIQSIKKAGTCNPVFLLDEVDKMSADFRGDPASALLEVLDPEQNNTFNDHYLDMDYDLSNVMFIATANVQQNIPAPLLDRMELIRLPGYTEEEKFEIARRHLIPKQVESHGLKPEQVEFTRPAVYEVIRKYTREAGVRNLEREIASICRKATRDIVADDGVTKVSVTPRAVNKYLGVYKYRHGQAEEKDQVGLTTGLAWTEVGGELLTIEVATVTGKGKVTITGKLGDVMQESAQAALSYVRSRADWLGIDKNLFQKLDIHIHVPEGATPKDGPSAGIALATSIASAFTKIAVRSTVAMTGEITLRGRVLPIGGLKEKLIAAHRGGLKKVLIPKDNEKDLAEIPKKIQAGLQIVPVEHMDEVLAHALTALPVAVQTPAPADAPPPAPAAPASEESSDDEDVVRH
ncbi:MAG: endopeptidase La [Bdellovibrionota bacterium]